MRDFQINASRTTIVNKQKYNNNNYNNEQFEFKRKHISDRQIKAGFHRPTTTQTIQGRLEKI